MNENDKIVEINSSGGNSQTDNSVDICNQIPSMPTEPQYAFAYIRFQNTAELCEPQNALENGTVFPVLNMPYCVSNSRTVK